LCWIYDDGVISNLKLASYDLCDVQCILLHFFLLFDPKFASQQPSFATSFCSQKMTLAPGWRALDPSSAWLWGASLGLRENFGCHENLLSDISGGMQINRSLAPRLGALDPLAPSSGALDPLAPRVGALHCHLANLTRAGRLGAAGVCTQWVAPGWGALDPSSAYLRGATHADSRKENDSLAPSRNIKDKHKQF
jgi:hypothetical protein